jgi:hypothetical protein
VLSQMQQTANARLKRKIICYELPGWVQPEAQSLAKVSGNIGIALHVNRQCQLVCQCSSLAMLTDADDMGGSI